MYFDATLYRADGSIVGPVSYATFENESIFDTFSKAAGDTTERWITLHPHGKDNPDGRGVPVKIRQNSDGTAHIISGAKELRGMRLTRLASPEELAERAKVRKEKSRLEAEKAKAAARQKEHEDLHRSASDPEYAQKLAQEKVAKEKAEHERNSKLDEIAERKRALHQRLLEHAGKITGDQTYTSQRARAAFDPSEQDKYKEQLQQAAQQTEEGKEGGAATSGAASVIGARNIRQVSTSLKALRRGIVGDLVEDPQLRAAVLGEEADLDPNAGKGKSVGGGPGYKRNVKGQAEAQGFTEEDAKEENDKTFEKRMEDMRKKGDWERADSITEMRAKTIERAAVARTLAPNLATAAPAAEVDPATIKQHAEHVRDFLQAHNELEELERQERRLIMGKDPASTPEEGKALEDNDQPAPGAEIAATVNSVTDPEFVKKLEAEVQDAAHADITRAFLDAMHGDGAEGKADDIIRREMQAHLGSGAYGHLSNVALAAAGHEGLDRQVVDALGIDAAAGLLAHALRRDVQDVASVRDGLAQAHAETAIPRMQEAMQLAQAARADLAELELPKVGSSTDLAAVRDLQKQRKKAIERAHSALGTALGHVEASAALNMALKGGEKQSLTVRLTGTTKQAAMQLRALGLQDGEYELKRDVDNNGLSATINRAGMDRLTAPLDADRRGVDQRMREIKSGQHDAEDYLPTGFMRRSTADLSDNPTVPASFQQQADWSAGVEQAVHDVAASMYADGHKPSEILSHLMDSVAQECPSEQLPDFAQTVTALLPFAEEQQRTAKDGTTYTAHVARDIDRDPDIAAQLGSLTRSWLDKTHPGESDFHSQRLEDNAQTREALFQAIAERPALQAAFAAPGDIGGNKEGRARAKAIQNYFFQHVISERLNGLSPREFDEQAKAKQAAALEKLGPEPEKWGGQQGGMFDMGMGSGDTVLHLNPHATPEQHAAALQAFGLRTEHYDLSGNAATLNEAGRAALKVPDTRPTLDGTEDSPEIVSGGLDSLNPEWVAHQRQVRAAVRAHPTLSNLWGDFKDTMRGNRNAYAAVQEVMQGDLMTRFTRHHAALTGQQMRVSKETTHHWERRLAATDPAEAERIRARDRKVMDEVRTRDGSGRYQQMGEGGLIGAVQEHLESQARQKMMQGTLFGAKHGGEVQARTPEHLDIGQHERLSLGRSAESQLSRLLGATQFGIKPTDGAVHTIPDLTWGAGTKHVTKQRAVKMLLGSGRMIGWLGAGSGKTGTMLGAFTEAHAQGQARKALYVVPSIVRNQFGEAAAQFTEPGKYSWHAEDASFDERRKHYQGDTHMVVTTHQTFRDDMLRLMAEHHGSGIGQFTEHFTSLSRPERAQLFADAMRHHGIPLDMVHVDEAHDFLNRAGKQDSTMSKVLEAALDNARYKALWTGSPVKNDPSEVHDWLAKVDPTRFADRDEFMRRYGVNTAASGEALRRLVDSYSVIDSVRPDIERDIVWGHRTPEGGTAALPLTEEQHKALEQVNSAYADARLAQRRGEVNVEACKTLSPRSFEGRDEAEHHGIAARLQSALGTLRESSIGRVVNEFDAPHNAKVQHVLRMAHERRGTGGVIFARNRRSITMLKEELERQGHRVGIINGSTTTDGKGQVRKAFNSGAVDIVLCSDAGATGANLQHRGQWLVNYDLPLTQKTLEQRNARIDRLGQENKIELHHLVTDTAYDRENVDRLTRKKELGSILQGEYRDMDDTGIASYIHRARLERGGDEAA